jgi:hypothetical protein
MEDAKELDLVADMDMDEGDKWFSVSAVSRMVGCKTEEASRIPFSHRMRIAHSGCAGLRCCQLLISKVDVDVSVGPYILGPVTLVQRDLEDSLSCFRSPASILRSLTSHQKALSLLRATHSTLSRHALSRLPTNRTP